MTLKCKKPEKDNIPKKFFLLKALIIDYLKSHLNDIIRLLNRPNRVYYFLFQLTVQPKSLEMKT